jgi:hypothetical protein
LANGGKTPHVVACYRFMNAERIINGRAAEKRADAPRSALFKGETGMTELGGAGGLKGLTR